MESKILILVDADGNARVLIEGAAGKSKRLALSMLLDAAKAMVSQLAEPPEELMTHQWLSFGDLLRTPVRWTEITKNLTLQAGYIVVFGSAAWARFASKDVLA